MPKRRRDTPVRNSLGGSESEASLARRKLASSQEDTPREQNIISKRRYKQTTARDSAQIVNGDIYYGNVEHHYNGAHIAHNLAESKQEEDQCVTQEAAEVLERRRKQQEQNRISQETMSSLLFDDMHFRYAMVRSPQTETCSWIVDTLEFKKWSRRDRMNKRHGCLLIRSKPGGGKSTMMKYAIKYAEEKAAQRAERISCNLVKQRGVDQPNGQDINVYFFFYAGGDPMQRTAEGMYRSILHQYASQEKVDNRQWLTLHNKPGLAGWQWRLEVLQATFEDALKSLGNDRLTCYIDALDECDEAQARDIVAFFEHLSEVAAARRIRFRFCFSSRHYPKISIKDCLEIVFEKQDWHRKDIQTYIKTRLANSTEAIRVDLQTRAKGVFLWVDLVVKMLNQEADRGTSRILMQQRLAKIPDDLNKLYENILGPRGSDRGDLLLILQWIMFASRPLTCQELYYAVRSGLAASPVFPAQDGYPSYDAMAKFVLHASRGLAELTQSEVPVVQFIHESVRGFLGGPEGLRTLLPHHSANVVGRSHERLKTCCLAYISADFVKKEAVSAAPQVTSFLRYATHGVLYHANFAHSYNISQDGFVTAFVPNSWMSIAQVMDPGQFTNASLAPFCIFAEAKADRLFRLIIRQHERFAVRPGRYSGSIGTVVRHEKPTEVELILRGCYAGQEPKDELLKDLMRMSMEARYIAVMALLLEQRWTGHIEDELCLKFLKWALTNEHVEVLELLVSHITQVNGYAHSILELAIEDGAHAVVRFLLSKQTGSLHDRQYSRLLRTAVYLGHYQIVEMMLDRGANVNFASLRHGHILWIAAKAGHHRVVQLLCERGAEVNKRCLEGMSTSLQVACFNRHVETVEVLLQYGADVNMDGAEYGTSLEAGLYWPHSSRAGMIVEMLRSHGAIV